MHRLIVLWGIILGVCLWCASSWAEKAYVTDSFEITLRSGPSFNNKINLMIPSGKPLEVLNSRGDWSQVRLLDGQNNIIEGWVLSRYLLDRTPWGKQTTDLNKNNSLLRERLSKVEEQLSRTIRQKRGLVGKVDDNSETLSELQKKYTSLRRGAVGLPELMERDGRDRSTLKRTRLDIERLSKENQDMKASEKIRWFATGALVLLCGLMIGWVIGRQHKSRKAGLSY